MSCNVHLLYETLCSCCAESGRDSSTAYFMHAYIVYKCKLSSDSVRLCWDQAQHSHAPINNFPHKRCPYYVCVSVCVYVRTYVYFIPHPIVYYEIKLLQDNNNTLGYVYTVSQYPQYQHILTTRMQSNVIIIWSAWVGAGVKRKLIFLKTQSSSACIIILVRLLSNCTKASTVIKLAISHYYSVCVQWC